MIMDFKVFSLLFFGYVVQLSYAGGGKHEKVHVKVHVPEIIKHHHHTKVVFIHKPHHKAAPKKPLVVHHHHHHKHDHGHKHKHGHNHGHKHQHGHKHNHKHKQNVYHHHEKVPHHHHHHKKHRYIANDHIVDHFPGHGHVYRTSQQFAKKERYRSNSFVPLVRPNYYNPQSSYKVMENGYDFTTSGYDFSPYPQLSSLVNPDAEYVGQPENSYDDSSENLSEDLNQDSPADYASNEHYEHIREPLHEEGYFDYEEETKKRLVGPDGQVLVTKTLTVGDQNGRHVSHSTEVV